MKRFVMKDTPLAGLKLIKRECLKDERGFFSRLFCAEELASIFNIEKHIVQINHTHTYQAGSIRGLHFQLPPHSEIKIVSCLVGKIFDVVVDLRKNSATFLQWHAEILSADNNHSLLIPEGFAHGFQTLTDDCHLIYCHSAFYAPHAEAGLHYQDSKLGIAWPCETTCISKRDQLHPFLLETFKGLLI